MALGTSKNIVNRSSLSNAASRVESRLRSSSLKIAERNQSTKDLLNINNGKFDFGAYQIDVRINTYFAAIAGVPTGGTTAGP